MKTWKQIALWGVVVALVFSLSVCKGKTEEAKTDEPPKEATLSSVEEEAKAVEEPTTEVEEKQEEEPVEEAKPVEVAPESAAAIIELEKGGRVVFEFYPKDAPKTVDNFIELTNKGYYDGLKFHRVIAGFMAQTGDRSGGPGYTIKAEFNSQKHVRGTVSMARKSVGPGGNNEGHDTAGSQFFICFGDTPHLDGDYTVFGQVMEGMEAVDSIVQGDVMKKVTIVDKASLKK